MVKVRDDLPIRKPTQQQHADVVEIDTALWLAGICEKLQVSELPNLQKACELIDKLSTENPDVNESEKDKYQTGTLESGIHIADIVSYFAKDEDVLVTAMLFRAVRRELITLVEVHEHFGDDILALVKGTMEMGQLSDRIEKNRNLEDHFNNNQKDHLAGIYKMLIAVTNDVRVVLVKLAERTHALRHLGHANTSRQQRVAREVMSIYAPLAHRLGIAQIKWELEDIAFRYLAPIRYKEIASLLAEKRIEREEYITTMTNTLQDELTKQGIEAEVFGRVKHIYSIYKKMKLKKLAFDELYDIRALRIMVNKKSDCYHVLGVVHELWQFIPSQFDDYITSPKANGYRSLHTAVIARNKSLEVQIRTHEMHYEAELGVCAHVNYKEGTKVRSDYMFDNKLNSLRQILASYQETTEKNDDDHDDENQSMQDWGALERIYVFTKDGDIKELPKGSTVLDFAYYLHTHVGNKCIGAMVNKKFVPLTYVLKTGIKVEIVTRKEREPKREWLVVSLGYMTTNKARAKLRQWFNQQDKSQHIKAGVEMLNEELERLGLHPNSVDLNDYLHYFKLNNTEDCLVAIAKGDIQLETVSTYIIKQLDLEPEIDEQELVPSVHPNVTGKLDAHKIGIEGLDNIDVSFANCCHPLQGEPIYGYITKQNGVKAHHEDCAELARLLAKEPERGIAANWHADIRVRRTVKVILEVYDRRGLLKDLTNVIDREHVNIVHMSTHSKKDGLALLSLDIEVIGLNQLSRLLVKLEQQPGIISAKRQKHN